MTEDERRLQISLRLKAGRHLAGRRSANGAAQALSPAELAQRDALIDEGISANRIAEIEQMKTAAKRSDLDALCAGMGLPADWFGGLYPADRGQAVNDSLGAVLLAVAEGAQEPHRASEGIGEGSRARGRRGRAAGGGGE